MVGTLRQKKINSTGENTIGLKLEGTFGFTVKSGDKKRTFKTSQRDILVSLLSLKQDKWD